MRDARLRPFVFAVFDDGARFDPEDDEEEARRLRCLEWDADMEVD